jgi:hypothetical protein
MAQRYLIPSGPMQTTASFAQLATGTNIITLLQIKPLVLLKVIEWGISFDGSSAATPGKVELIETDVAATVTASVDADCTKLGDGVSDAEVFSTFATLSTSGTGYNAAAEGSITSVRNLAGPQFIAPTNQFIQQFPLGREPVIQKAKFGRIRVKFGTTVNAYAYIIVEV